MKDSSAVCFLLFQYNIADRQKTSIKGTDRTTKNMKEILCMCRESGIKNTEIKGKIFLQQIFHCVIIIKLCKKARGVIPVDGAL